MNTENSILKSVNEQVAEERKTATEMDGKYLTFKTDGQLFGVPIAEVVQIVGIQQITEIPQLPNYAKGIINLRGSIIPLIDVRLRFGKQECAYNERTCIIVTAIHKVTIGFIVDEVDAVTAINSGDISPPPEFGNYSVDTYLTGVAKVENKVVLLVGITKLLPPEVVTTLSNTQG